MSKYDSSRREFIKSVGLGAAALAIPSGHAKERGPLLAVNPEPRFDLSPYLYMQFMEPLGTTDGSVAAAWDFKKDCWLEFCPRHSPEPLAASTGSRAIWIIT